MKAAPMIRASLRVLAVVAAAWALSFALFSTLPGDRARAMAGAQASRADVDTLRRSLLLDAPWFLRLARHARNSVHPATISLDHRDCATLGPMHLNFGHSTVYRRPVTALLRQRVGPSLALAVTVSAAATALGLLLGFYSRKHGRARSLVPASRIVSAIPAFALGIALHEVFARRLGWLPLEASLDSFGSALRSAVLPVATLTATVVGPYVAVAHERWKELERAPFVIAAIARGDSPARALWRHGNRQVAAHLIGMASLDAGTLVGGAVLTERLFRWPGLGSLAVEGLLGRDVMVISATVVVAATGVVVANVAGNLLVMALDPRAAESDRCA